MAQNPENWSDQEIVLKTLDDKSFFLHIIGRYKIKLLNYIIRISGLSADDAEDVLQEAFIKVYRNLRNYDHELKFSSWIYRIAHNQVIDNYRKLKARPQSAISSEDESYLNNIQDDLDLEKDLDLVYLRQHIKNALGKLDSKYREVLVLRYFEEKDYNEISDIIKKPVGTVGSMLNKAKKDLKKVMDRGASYR